MSYQFTRTGAEIENLHNKADGDSWPLSFDSEASMISGTTTSGVIITHQIGKRLFIIGDPISKMYETVNSVTDISLGSGLYAKQIMIGEATNRFKGNQNFNVQGDQGVNLPDSTPRNYAVGTQFTSGRFVVGSNLVNAKYENGIFDADSGSYYIEYNGDFVDDFYGVKTSNDEITNEGCSISISSGKTRLTIDMSIAPPHKFAGLSEIAGLWIDISDNESELIENGGYILDGNSKIYTDGSVEQEHYISIAGFNNWFTIPFDAAGVTATSGVAALSNISGVNAPYVQLRVSGGDLQYWVSGFTGGNLMVTAKGTIL